MTTARAAFAALTLVALTGAASAQLFPPGDVPGGRQSPPPGTFQQPAPPPGTGIPRGQPVERQALPPPPGQPRDTFQQPEVIAPAQQPRQQAARPPAAGQQPTATPPSPAGQVPAGNDDFVVVAPPAQRIENRTAVYNGLDKITGRIIVFDVALNETVQFGALQVTPRACYTRPPNETPNTTSFMEVDEITLQGEIRRIFNGWMFAASPGLHGVEHPIYDIWLVDCKQAPPDIEATQKR